MKYISKDGKTAMEVDSIRKKTWGIKTFKKMNGRWIPDTFYRKWVFESEADANRALAMLADGLKMKGE